MTHAIFCLHTAYKLTYYFDLVDPIDYKYTAFCEFGAKDITHALQYSPNLCDLTDNALRVTNESCIDNTTFIPGNDTEKVCIGDISLNHELLKVNI